MNTTSFIWLIISLTIINNQLIPVNTYKSENNNNRKPDDQELEALLAESQDKCTGRRCVQSDQCCPGSVCVDVDGIVGTCLPIYGVSEGDSCQTDDDCEPGLNCRVSDVNYAQNPSALYQVRGRRVCQSAAGVGGGAGAGNGGREMMKKQYNNECQTSSECDSGRGLCCQLIKRHRMAPRKLCYYFSDPQSCVGPVDITYAKPIAIHHGGPGNSSPNNVFFKARIG
ncbi:ITG-like peptide [Oppia nitens]|uniref:ITG-like peptide n=1 Tax=Oppia nitens TaxID=1686743 RepID=UPI0023DA839B|nr:ITG-like peptide [Oppia nitens]